MSFLRPKDETRPWKGRYAPYDLVKELCIAVGVIALLAVLLTVLFSSPDDKPSTIAPVVARTARRLRHHGGARSSTGRATRPNTAPPTTTTRAACSTSCSCTHSAGSASAIRSTRPRTTWSNRWKRSPTTRRCTSALAEYKAAPEKQKKEWSEAYAKPLEEYATAVEEKKTPPSTVSVDKSTGTVTVKASGAGPVPMMMASLQGLAQSGGLEGGLRVRQPVLPDRLHQAAAVHGRRRAARRTRRTAAPARRAVGPDERDRQLSRASRGCGCMPSGTRSNR